MLRSMTGFGAAQAEIKSVSFSVEIRSVNNRYYKLTTKLPDIWASAETEIEKRIRKVLTRGSVTVNVRMKVASDQAACQINTKVLAGYLDQLKLLQTEADPTMRIDLASLLQLPGVCEPLDRESLCKDTYGGLMELIDQAIAALNEMRKTEGAALRSDLLGHCDTIERELNKISARAGQVVLEYHDRLRDRVQELLAAARLELDSDTLAREVAIYAERCDIAEEINRLTGHIEQFRLVADDPEPAGRKLDFIAQEMLRETNTIGSKSNDAEIMRAVLEIKTAVDRIKEQSANAE